MSQTTTYSGNIVDVLHERIYPGTLFIQGGRIAAIVPESAPQRTFLMPGFVDAHVHIESSMLPPAEFARAAVCHGTVATVSDPHEIANVLGMPGIHYMLTDGGRVPMKFAFGAPACVPATSYETAGAQIGLTEIKALLASPEIRYLSEVMNYPAVVQGDPAMMRVLHAAKALGKRIDGHAPGLSGDALRTYAAAGITTDHEVTTLAEARERIACGMKVLIREGSAARNSEVLLPLIAEHPAACMFCSDDLHPDNLVDGHIDRMVRAACRQGIDLMQVLRCACVNPVAHYGLDVGLLQPGHPADFIEVDNLEDFHVMRTVIKGQEAARGGMPMLPHLPSAPINAFAAVPYGREAFAVRAVGPCLRVIEVIDGQLVTGAQFRRPTICDGNAVADPAHDLLKIAVANRYRPAPPAVGFVTGVGLRLGAFAASVAHDSHNILAIGASDAALCAAVNAVIEMQGGLAVVDEREIACLPLPVAGLMSDEDFHEVARRYAALDQRVKDLGASLRSPFMALSFLALLVIPRLKISDRGLFDADTFALVSPFSDVAM